MASIFEILFGKKDKVQANPYIAPSFKGSKPEDVLTPSALARREQMNSVSKSGAPEQLRKERDASFSKNETAFIKNVKPLIAEGADAAYGFFKAQEELAKPVKRNQGESNLDYALRSTGTKFLPGIASQGYKAAEVAVPALRASTFTPTVIGKLSNGLLPESVSSKLTPLLQLYSIARSPNKWVAAGNIGIDYGTDFTSKLFTGKTLNENIDQSSLPDWAKGGAKTAYNMLSSLAGAKVGTKVGKYVGDVSKAGKAALPAIAEGRRVYNQTGSFDKALDAMTYNNLELEKGLKKAITGESEVKGFTNIPKNLEPLAQEALKYKNADEFVSAQTSKGYRSNHQIDTNSSVPITQLDSGLLDVFINDFKEKYGYPSLKSKDVAKLKSLTSDPNADVIVYRASPKNELNSGDWVTIDKTYANDIRRQNGGKVFTHTIKASELLYPKTIDGFRDLPSLNKWGAFQYKSSTEEAMLKDLWNQAHSQKQEGVSQVKGWNNISKETKKNLVTNADGSFSFVRNTEKAPNLGSKFAQDIEPAGRYINLLEVGDGVPKGWETGNIKLENPLVVDWKTSGHGGWKTELSKRFGVTGKKLSEKIAQLGYDSIITVDGKGGRPMEVVDLSMYKPSSSVKGFTNIPKPIDASEVKVPPKVVEQKFRGDKLNLEPEQLKQIEDRLSGLGLTSRNVRSFDEMKALADELGTDPRALLSGNGKLTDAKVIALKNLINQNADFIAKNSGLKFKTEQENAIHQQKLRTADAQINEALAQLIGGGTELGRGIAAFRVLANKSMEPSFWYKKGQQTRGNALTPEQKANIDGLIKDNDRIGLSMYVASLRDPSLSEKFTTLWKAGLLTNVTTHVANVAGNASMAALRGLSNVVGTGLDKIISLGTGKRTMTVSPGAAVGGLGKGAKKGLNILRTGVNPDDFEGKLDIRGNINFGDSILGKVANGYTRAVFGSLQAEDALFRGMHQSASLANQAKLIAINEGLKGQARQARIAELLENPTDAMKQTAIEEARIATFNNDNIVASKVGQLKAGRNKDDSFGSKVLSTVVDVTMPFVKTPTNVVARIAEYTPLGLLKLAAGQLNKNTRGQKRLVEDLSKVVTGGAVLALGSALANQGMLTGSLPASPSERAQWEAEGKMPNSIKINGRWYQVNKLAPIGFLFALAADNATSGSVAETGLKGLKNLTDQTFLTGLSGGIKAVTDPEQNAASYAKQTVSSLIPSGLGAIARVIDPTVRTTGGVGEAIQAKIPGLSSSLAPRLRRVRARSEKRRRFTRAHQTQLEARQTSLMTLYCVNSLSLV
jgi:hypothetical protein